MSDEVIEVIGRHKAVELRAGPEPGHYEHCEICHQPGDADTEPTSVLVHLYPRKGAAGSLINILWTHADCAVSTVTRFEEEVDVGPLMGVGLIPILMAGDSDDQGTAALLMEPRLPAIERTEQHANAHIQRWLANGLSLLTVHDLDHLRPMPGWRAVMVPGEHAGLTRVTVLCRTSGSHSQPITVVSDLGIRVDQAWLGLAATRGQVALYGGLTGVLSTDDRSPLHVIRALVNAARVGTLTGALIEASVITL
jgi:hypothetical protein